MCGVSGILINEILDSDSDMWSKEEFVDVIKKSGNSKSSILVDTLFRIHDNHYHSVSYWRDIIQLAIEEKVLLGESVSCKDQYWRA